MAVQNVAGFIIDVPKCLVETAKGDYHMVTGSSAEVSFGGDSLTIDGGWSFYSLAEIDKKKTLEIKISDTQFDMNSLSLASGGNLTTAATNFKYFGDPFEIDGTGKFIINKVVEPNSIRINGYEEVLTAPIAGQFKVTIAATTTVQFVVGDAGKKVYPSYSVAVASAPVLSVLTTSFPGAGKCTMTFPIYSGADAEDSIVEGYGQITIFKAKILQSAKLGGSYKSLTNNDISLKGLDPRRPDGKMWEFKYIPA
jgi:hypothetical protein